MNIVVIGPMIDIIIMIENIFDTRPPVTNHLLLAILTNTGTMAVFMNMQRVNLNATDKL